MRKTVTKTKPSTGRQSVRHRSCYRKATVHAAVGPRYYSLKEAAGLVRLSKRSLQRAHMQGLLRLRRAGIHWYASHMALITTPLFTVGHAARELKIHYETAREWVAKGWLKPIVVGHTRCRPTSRVSMLEIQRAKARRKKR